MATESRRIGDRPWTDNIRTPLPVGRWNAAAANRFRCREKKSPAAAGLSLAGVTEGAPGRRPHPAPNVRCRGGVAARSVGKIEAGFRRRAAPLDQAGI